MIGTAAAREQLARYNGLRIAKNGHSRSVPALRVRVAPAAIRSQAVESDSLSFSGKEVFGSGRELSQLQGIVQSLTTPVRYAVCSALVLGAAGVGFAAGSKLTSSGHVDAADVAEQHGPSLGGIAGAAVLGAAGAGAAYVFNKETTEVAAAELQNALAGLADATALDPSVVTSITEKYGVSADDDRLREEKKALYDRFVTAVIPPGNDPLDGTESDVISAFKASLLIEDEDAAAVHIEIGRRIFRQRLETGDKETALEERKSFQKLLYVSSLVFGPKAKFLLPWKRLFKVSDAQVEVSIRNNAQALFQGKLEQSNMDADVEKLKALRKFQKQIRLSDDIAADMVRAQARARLEGFITQALDVLKARTRLKDIGKVVAELDALRGYNASLAIVAKAAPADELVPGLGSVSVFGGDFDSERQMDDLKLLYKAYLAEALESGSLSDDKVEALSELRNVFGMGRKEAEEATEEVTAKAYKRQLANAVTSGALDKAPSKAEFLSQLCDDLRFDPEQAAAIHADIYRQKLQQCLEDKALSDDDVAALNRLRVLLCVPKAVVDKAHGDVCGDIFTKIVDEAIGAGVDGYDGDMKEAVQKAVKGLRLPVEAALEIATKAVRAVFLTYIKRARSTMNRTEAARELKKMVLFSNLTVSQLVEDIRGGPKVVEQSELGEGGKMLASAEAASKEGATEGEKAEEEENDEDYNEDGMPLLQSLRKTKGKQKEGKAQKEITVKADLELRERLDMYKTFLLFCLQGDTTGMPMGTALVVQRDTSDFVRLGQLGDILGLTPLEVSSVHQDLAEQAFKVQAQTILADGQLSKARTEQLKEVQQQLGLNDAAAQKVVQSITSTKMAGAIDAAVRQGKLTVEEVRQLKESGVEIETMVAKKVREQMFEKLVRQALDSGRSDFNKEEVMVKLPADLGLDLSEAERKVKEIAGERLKGALVQAASSLRQKRKDQVVASLNNLLACDSVAPAPEALTWPVKSELYDLYSVFVGNIEPSAPAATRLRELLDIDESTAGSLEEVVATGSFSLDILDPAAEEKFVF